jgi:hypothetical protein
MRGRIEFRCPTCRRYFARPRAEAGKRFTCSCREKLRVPRRLGRSPLLCRSLTDRAAMLTVYGGGGAILGFCLAVVFEGLLVAPLFMLAGLIVGGLGGEPVVNFMGRTIRQALEREGD